MSLSNLSIRTMRRRMVALAAASSVAVALSGCATTDAPAESEGPTISGRVTIVVPYAPGGGTDLLGRHLAKLLSDKLGTPVVVENQQEGGQVPAMTRVSQAQGDGTTLLFIANSLLTAAPAGNTDLTLKDFSPIAVINAEPVGFAVNSSSKWQTIEEVIADSKSNPGSVSVAATAPGSLYHMAPSILAEQTGVQFNMVPFDSAAPSLTALLGNHVDMAVTTVPEMLEHVKAGTLRLLAHGGLEPIAALPNVPSVTDLALVDSMPASFRAIVGPADMSDEIAQYLSDTITEVAASKEYLDFLAENNMTPLNLDRNETTEYLSAMEKQFTALIKGS